MFEELNERRKAVECNIAKGFCYSLQEEIVEKAEDNDIEKGKWNVGDTFTRHGITYKCTGFSAATGRPTWSRVKGGASKQDTEDSVKKINKVNQRESEKKMSDDEKKRVMRLAEKVSADSKDAPRHLEEEAMPYDELVRFEQAMRIFSGSSDLNKITRENCKKWSELARTEMNSREEQEKKKKEEEKEDKKYKKLSELKRGDTVALIMERYNPQLGDYVTIQKKQIEGTTSKSFVVDYKKFDKESGERKDKSTSVYGSSKYYIMVPEEINKYIKDGKWKGDRISGGNPFEEKEQ